jgi:hypothetical protein
MVFEKLSNPVGSIKKDLCSLAAYLCTVSARNAALINNFSLPSHNPDCFGRAFPYAGIACTAKLFNGVHQHINPGY